MYLPPFQSLLTYMTLFLWHIQDSYFRVNIDRLTLVQIQKGEHICLQSHIPVSTCISRYTKVDGLLWYIYSIYTVDRCKPCKNHANVYGPDRLRFSVCLCMCTCRSHAQYRWQTFTCIRYTFVEHSNMYSCTSIFAHHPTIRPWLIYISMLTLTVCILHGGRAWETIHAYHVIFLPAVITYWNSVVAFQLTYM